MVQSFLGLIANAWAGVNNRLGGSVDMPLGGWVGFNSYSPILAETTAVSLHGVDQVNRVEL